MTTMVEGNIQISFPCGVNVRKFDDKSHGLSYCMKAVDFIVELEDRVSFIEIKDFEHPRAPSENREVLIEDFQNEGLDHDLIYKFRDSFLYEWACKRVDKPIDYWILIASEALTKAHLGPRIEAIKRKLPLSEALPEPAKEQWEQRIVAECGVFNISTWNKYFPNYPVERI